MTTGTAAAPGATVSPDTLALARHEVRDLLSKSDAFRALSPEVQREIARNTVEVATYLAEPDGIRTAQAPQDAYAFAQAGSGPTRTIGGGEKEPGEFKAQAAREGAAVAGALLQAVNFPDFVSQLVQGVFHAIVTSSIEQMEAYGKLVADVSKSLNEFRDDNISENMGRDHLVDQFPDTFEISLDTGDMDEGQGPRVKLRDGVDEKTALDKVNRTLPVEGGPAKSLDDDTIEGKLVPAARTQLATSRQQLLATMVMMGINRIVVTDGRLSAKVMYDFQARDNFKYRASATKFDYGDQYKHTSSGDYESDSQGADYNYSRDKEGGVSSSGTGARNYAKGTYKYEAEPVLKLASATQESTDAALQTKASLAGVVDINFKSDYFPLEKMADSFQIARIQNAADPSKPAPAGGGAAPAPAPAPATTTPAQP